MQLWLISICHRKQRPTLARIGYVGLIVPGLFVFPLIGAIRLAPPSSNWAAMHYRDRLMGASARRYPDDHDVAVGFSLPRPARTTWERLIMIGMVATGLVFVTVFPQSSEATAFSLITLAQLTIISWLAEVELAAKPYSRQFAPTPAAELSPAPTPAIH